MCADLEGHGFQVGQVPVTDDGLVEPREVATALRPDTILITLMLANNEVGTIQPVAEIAAMAGERGILVHSEGAQIHPRRRPRAESAGGENVAGIVGLGTACEVADRDLEEEGRGLAGLRDRPEAGLLAQCASCRVNGQRERRLPNTLSISFHGLLANAILF